MGFRKTNIVLSVALCACVLSGCSIFITSDSSLSSAVSSETSASIFTSTSDSNESESDLNFPATLSSTTAGKERDSTESSSATISDEPRESTSTDGLVKYDSIYDIPFADLDYEMDRNALSLNGESWVAAPGPTQLSDLCFSDGKILILQCFYRDSQNFVWFTASFDANEEAPYFPAETDNKLFIYAKGYTLYTDNGYQYTIENP